MAAYLSMSCSEQGVSCFMESKMHVRNMDLFAVIGMSTFTNVSWAKTSRLDRFYELSCRDKEQVGAWWSCYSHLAQCMFVRWAILWSFYARIGRTEALFEVSAVTWSIVYSFGPKQAVELGLLMIFRDFLLSGVIIATILWWVVSNSWYPCSR